MRPKLPEDQKLSVPVYVLLNKAETELLDALRGRRSRGSVLREAFRTLHAKHTKLKKTA